MPDGGALDALRATLPGWTGLLPLGWIPLGAAIALLAAFAGVAIALLPWIGVRPDAHWTERARRGWPARAIATSSPILLAILMGLYAGGSIGPLSTVPASVLGVLVGVAAFAGAWTTIPIVERIVKKRAWSARELIGGQAFSLLAMVPHLIVTLVAAALMPVDPLGAAIGTALVVASCIGIALGGGLRIAELLGLAWPADARVTAIVEACGARVGTRARRVMIVRWPVVNAIAYPRTGDLCFTEEAIRTLTDAEIDAVSAHELGHLSEPPKVVLWRSLGVLSIAPIALIRPVWHATRDADLVVRGLAVWSLLVAVIVIARVVRSVSQKMEERADAVAHEHEEARGAYAQALARIYELNLVPAVVAARRQVHPHLYDRLVSAGVTPDYPRPAPPSAWPRVAGLLATMLIALALDVAIPFAVSAIDPALELGLRGGDESTIAAIADARWVAGDREGALTAYVALAEIAPDEPYWPEVGASLAAEIGECDRAHALFAEAESRVHARGDDPAPLVDAWADVMACVER